MAEVIKTRWLVDNEQNKVAPKTLSSQILNDDGTLFKDAVASSLEEKASKTDLDAVSALVGDTAVSIQIANAITNVETEIATHASNSDIHVTAEEKEAWSNIKVPSLDGYATEEYVENLYKKLNSNTVLGFYCIEDVIIVINGISKTYPANSNVEISFIEDDVFEIIPTSDNSILSLNAYPGALDTFYPWLEGVAQFSNILFDMNAEEFYSKWSQGNQGQYHVQTAQYVNCIFWSDNPYISEVARRTNYTLTHTSQLPLCYSTIPDNTFKSFYLAFNANVDPNWSNAAYKESFAKANWATQVFSYYGARVVGFPGHDSPTLTITLPKDCRGLMFDARNIECAGVFDAANTTNFGAKSGSWREAFGNCSFLRRLYIKNLKVNLNISWSPIDYASIKYIIDSAANTNAITISVSPYTYNLLSESDFELATSKKITISLITTNYIEDKRLSKLDNYYTKVETEEYINTVISNIEIPEPETNENVLLKTEQTLTDEELAQVKTNLRYIGKGVGGLEVTPYVIEEKDFGTENHRIEETPSEPVIAGVGAEVFNLYDGMNVASGAYSVSQGHHTVATGDYAVAQGHWTMATGMASKASGLLAMATGHYSTADGTRTLASKNNCHAEGDTTKATAASAHSEGNETVASGNVSHAEGWKTKATGIASHAEGEGTIAAGRGQTAMGRWNVSDTSSKLLVGIGTSDTARKNGFKVSSTGQGYFASDVYANDSKKLATEEYVDTKEYDFFIMKSSTPGSNKKFKITINDDGILSSEKVIE